jgi:hypothetical protein
MYKRWSEKVAHTAAVALGGHNLTNPYSIAHKSSLGSKSPSKTNNRPANVSQDSSKIPEGVHPGIYIDRNGTVQQQNLEEQNGEDTKSAEQKKLQQLYNAQCR